MKDKKSLFIILLFSCIFIFAISAYGESIGKQVTAYYGAAKLRLNGKEIPEETIIIDGTTFVPLRAIGEMLDLEVKWDDSIKTVDLFSKVAETAENEPVPQELAKNAFNTAQELQDYLNDKYGKISLKINENEILFHVFFFVSDIESKDGNERHYAVRGELGYNAMHLLTYKSFYYKDGWAQNPLNATDDDVYSMKML